MDVCAYRAAAEGFVSGSRAPHCWLPAPQSLLTLVSGPPLPPLPPFPLLRSGKYIRDRTLEQKPLLPREPESEDRLSESDAAMQMKAPGGDSCFTSSLGDRKLLRAQNNHACNLG